MAGDFRRFEHLRARWRAAMRGKQVAEDMLYQLLASVPPKADRAIVIFPVDGDWSCKWIGLTAEEAANALYQMADTIVDQKIPPPDWRTRIHPAR